MKLISFMAIFIISELTFASLRGQGVSSLSRVGGGGGSGGGGGTVMRETPFQINKVNRRSIPLKTFNVARVRGGSKDSTKLVKLFNLVKENHQKNQDKSSLPTELKFTIIQHVRDNELYIARNGSRDYALNFSKPKDFVDQDNFIIDTNQLSEVGKFEYSSLTGEAKTLQSGKRTIRLYNVLEKALLIDSEIVIPDGLISEEGFTKEAFLSSLKSGGIFETNMPDEYDCSACSGGYIVIETSSLGRDRLRCKNCQGRGKINTQVNFRIIWDLSMTEVEKEY